uniref:ATPase component of various ABC-type transport systems with duplicated ATPase domain n=1 Tax=Eubacterium cellulosolvens (strain ATCC 43171 / JCM 9499 / 6) TaxID=633697 RepID=I5AWZ2_EUBC6
MIRAEGLSFRYSSGKGPGIRNINLHIRRGECVLLCGPSGSGKTTLIRTFNGLVPNFFKGEIEGTVRVNGRDVCRAPSYKIAEDVGCVFQNPKTQFFNVDTDSEIVFGLENMAVPQKQIRERMQEVVTTLKLEDLTGRNIFELSGGEKQRIAFASAYAMKPELFLLDEPSSNLDVEAIERLGENLKTVKAEGKTLVITEHRIYYLMDIVDRVIYMKDGEIHREYNREEFIKLPGSQLAKMGLRTTDLANVRYPSEAKEQQESEAVLTIRDLSAAYRKKPVFRGINLKASGGEIIAITGRNGEGKTTFVRTLCGLQKKAGGEIRFNERIVKPKERQRMSYMVMQDVNYQLFAESVEAECTFGLENISQESVREVLKELEIYDRKEMHPHLLSGGQKQRLAVAVSVLSDKQVIVFDEPTSGLDYESMRRVGALLRRLAAKGKIILVVTHDRELMADCCSRLIVLRDGSIEKDIPVTEDNKEVIDHI